MPSNFPAGKNNKNECTIQHHLASLQTLSKQIRMNAQQMDNLQATFSGNEE